MKIAGYVRGTITGHGSQTTWVIPMTYVQHGNRQEESTLELTKVASMLMAIDNGENLTNKKIDDLNKSKILFVVSVKEENNNKKHIQICIKK